MAQTRGSFSQLSDNTERDVYSLLDQSLKERPAIWRGIYNIEESKRKTEISLSYVEIDDVPEKGEGESYQTGLIRPGHEKQVSHTEFGFGFELTKTAKEDDLYGVLKRNTKMLAYSARYVEEKRAALPFNNGFSTELSADGVSAFNASHVLAGGGTARNTFSAAQDLSWNALAQAMIDAQTQTKTEGNRFVDVIDSWVLYVPPALEFTAARIIHEGGLPGTQDNDKNVLAERRKFKLVVNPHLSDDDTWFLLAADKSRHGFCSYTRVPINLEPMMVDPRTKNELYTIRFRRSWFVREWQNSFGVQGA
jgi:hypothetical protein